ncbi:carboxypeptidase regulatory-like domain-containing protein [Hymenobacter ruricola]|uniref:Carboxypeptidase regulatory-like domain-containing protein n=1 Tax=Hymenobacter ruricola TaxID=2791023 RepID=A0ABS0I3I7_9BACT|nr:carboxypeptidase regulatory-like domain-containing protein [Hymenobacter ruricola]MBF9221498.1 carboxypeptidase regulatory-like domain-containing protein [Hymenobacter ruricola]
MSLTSTLLASLLLGLAAAESHAGASTASNSAASFNDFIASAPRDTSVVAPAAPATRVIYGRVESPAGALPGAVVRLTGSKQTTVTNAAGEFSLAVPVASGPVAATVSYAGYADVPVVLSVTEQNDAVKLTSPHVIKVSRKQQAKHYLKTAHRQIRRTLRKL